MSRPQRSRPAAANYRTAGVSGGNLDTLSLEQIEHAEQDRRRVRLVADLHRLADRLERHDRPAAELARFFAREAA